MRLDKNLSKTEWQQLAALVQQSIETGQCSPSDLQRRAGNKLIAAIEEASRKRPKKPPRDRWWLRVAEDDFD